MAQRREREKTHIEKTSAGKFHSSGCVDTQHTDCILWFGILIRRSFIAKKAEWYKETTTQSERKREKKSIENVFIHLCQVNEHGICTMFPSLCIIQWNTHTTVASLPLYRCAFFVVPLPSHDFLSFFFLKNGVSFNAIVFSIIISRNLSLTTLFIRIFWARLRFFFSLSSALSFSLCADQTLIFSQ